MSARPTYQSLLPQTLIDGLLPLIPPHAVIDNNTILDALIRYSLTNDSIIQNHLFNVDFHLNVRDGTSHALYLLISNKAKINLVNELDRLLSKLYPYSRTPLYIQYCYFALLQQTNEDNRIPESTKREWQLAAEEYIYYHQCQKNIKNVITNFLLPDMADIIINQGEAPTINDEEINKAITLKYRLRDACNTYLNDLESEGASNSLVSSQELYNEKKKAVKALLDTLLEVGVMDIDKDTDIFQQIKNFNNAFTPQVRALLQTNQSNAAGIFLKVVATAALFIASSPFLFAPFIGSCLNNTGFIHCMWKPTSSRVIKDIGYYKREYDPSSPSYNPSRVIVR